MRIRKKIKNRSGFTLAETLVAIIILLLVSSIVAEGVPVAQNAYDKVVVAANAKVMLSTAITALRNELATAQRITVKDNKTITYYSTDRGAMSKIYLYAKGSSEGDTESDEDTFTDGTVMLQEYADYGSVSAVADKTGLFDILQPNWTEETTPEEAKARALASSLEARRGGKEKLYVRFDTITKTSNIITVTGLKVCRSSDANGSKPLAQYGTGSNNTLKIRVIAGQDDFAYEGADAPVKNNP